MITVTLTKGLPASGKSTWAKEQLAKNPGGIKRVNKDDLRDMLDNGKWSKGNEKLVLRIRDEIIREALEAGKHVIVDDTNLHPTHERRIKTIAKEFDAKIEIKDFTDVPLEVCIERDLKREKSVGRKVIMRMYNQHLRKEAENKPLEPMIFDAGLPFCIIFDIDGTLATIGDRSPYDGKSCATDIPNTSIIALSRMVYDQTPTKVILFSGRNGDSQPETEKWLEDNGVLYDEIHMRPEGDLRKDSKLKWDMFEEFIKDKYNVLFIVDDRNQVVDMWREKGITCLQVNEGDF